MVHLGQEDSNMATNPVVQRLIAAGASPARAQQFVQQYTQSVAGRTAPAGTKPKSIEDWFDLDLAAAVESQYPTAYSWLPNINDPQSVKDYITGAYGPNQVKLLEDKAVRLNAPNFTRIHSTVPVTADGKFDFSKGNVDQWIVFELVTGESAGTIKSALSDPTSEIKKAATLYPDNKGIKIGDAASLATTVDSYSGEKTKADKSKETYLNSFIQGDKYFKSKIPNPKFTYGDKTDLANGIIDFRTHPTVVAELNKVVGAPGWSALAPNPATGIPKTKQQPNDLLVAPVGNPRLQTRNAPNPQYTPQIETLGNAYKAKEQELFKSIQKDKNTPFEDEKARRVILRRANKK